MNHYYSERKQEKWAKQEKKNWIKNENVKKYKCIPWYEREIFKVREWVFNGSGGGASGDGIYYVLVHTSEFAPRWYLNVIFSFLYIYVCDMRVFK